MTCHMQQPHSPDSANGSDDGESPPLALLAHAAAGLAAQLGKRVGHTFAHGRVASRLAGSLQRLPSRPPPLADSGGGNGAAALVLIDRSSDMAAALHPVATGGLCADNSSDDAGADAIAVRWPPFDGGTGLSAWWRAAVAGEDDKAAAAVLRGSTEVLGSGARPGSLEEVARLVEAIKAGAWLLASLLFIQTVVSTTS